jgi:hypothetical protein
MSIFSLVEIIIEVTRKLFDAGNTGLELLGLSTFLASAFAVGAANSTLFWNKAYSNTPLAILAGLCSFILTGPLLFSAPVLCTLDE